MTVAATPFHKILVANRGEIALRVMRTAHAMGYRTVAVYSTADAGARHVREAGQSVCIGEPLPAQSYLRADALIAAARLAGADAVHPGYGFLAENADFAQACRDAGLVFIGPSAEAIRAMGHKAGAKALMLEAGVPCIPGYQGEDQDEARMAQEAARIGYPVMVKATAGGGGRGMRLVQRAEDFPGLLRSARSEAQNAFGDPGLILERAIVAPRHIEIQVFTDRHGNAIHLGERDCSVQRRHQKLVEEAPSPAVDAGLRARMGAVAVRAVQAIGYEGAGTLEFLLDGDGNFYFMEMNTRLQVEHPVTEAITGLDLVAWQLRVASGEPLPLTQEQVRFQGHAIEVRLCAEDAGQDFMPQSGAMALWQMPATLRVEHALQSGAEVPPYYDSMLAKLVAHGDTREAARRQLLAGLEDAVALGVTTNQAFLQRCLAHPVFAAGGATTAFVAEQGPALLAPDAALRARAAAVAAALLEEGAAAPHAEPARLSHDLSQGLLQGLSQGLSHGLPVALRFALDGQALDARLVQPRRHRHAVEIEGVAWQVDIEQIDGQVAQIRCDGLGERVVFHRDGARLLLHYRGQALQVLDLTRAASVQRGERGGDQGGDGSLRASMTGRTVAVLAAVGERVQAGQPLVTLEAMKMEHVHAAPCAGRLRALHVAVGEQVAAGRLLALVEAEPAA